MPQKVKAVSVPDKALDIRVSILVSNARNGDLQTLLEVLREALSMYPDANITLTATDARKPR